MAPSLHGMGPQLCLHSSPYTARQTEHEIDRDYSLSLASLSFTHHSICLIYSKLNILMLLSSVRLFLLSILMLISHSVLLRLCSK